MSHRRLTLICRDSHMPDRDWNLSHSAPTRVVVTEQLSVVRYALSAELGVDVARIVIESSASADEFLTLLTELPHHFNGDALYLKDDGSGFLSAAGRGDGRVLYSLKANDIRFYLETAGVVSGHVSPPRPLLVEAASAAA